MAIRLFTVIETLILVLAGHAEEGLPCTSDGLLPGDFVSLWASVRQADLPPNRLVSAHTQAPASRLWVSALLTKSLTQCLRGIYEITSCMGTISSCKIVSTVTVHAACHRWPYPFRYVRRQNLRLWLQSWRIHSEGVSRYAAEGKHLAMCSLCSISS